MTGTAYTTETEIIHIFEGRLSGRCGNLSVSIGAGETLLIRRNTYFDFEKTADAGQAYRSMLFFLKDEFIDAFFKTQLNHIIFMAGVTTAPFYRINAAPTVSGFMTSLLPYFSASPTLQTDIVKVKTWEILINLAALQPEVLAYLTQPAGHDSRLDLVVFMERSFTKNLSLQQFAHQSGRSLSTFKREFEAIFNMSPARWLKERRLQLAKQLIQSTAKSVTEIGLEVGFEDPSHFTKAFKLQFGVLPKAVRGRV
jgi:AraC family transcriptional regulator, exoenzyme S synthesis regulatory protein ExsA